MDKPCLVIAEIAQAHDGSLGIAHSYVDAVAAAGADAVKFQTHIAEAESTPHEPWRVKFSRQDDSRFAYWRRMQFTRQQWAELKDHAEQRGLRFLSSAFSIEAVELLDSLGMDVWKVASGETQSLNLLEAMIRTGKPIWLSSGMSSWESLDRAARMVRDAGNDLLIFQCTTLYPTPPDLVGLNVLSELRDRYDCPVGLSDHSGTIFPGLAACALGASAVEVHTTFSRNMFGPDATSSLEIDELRRLVEGIRFLSEVRSNPVDKDEMSRRLYESNRIFSKSITLLEDLPAGSELTDSVVAFRKPGTGIASSRWPEIRGRRISRDLRRFHVVTEQDLADPS